MAVPPNLVGFAESAGLAVVAYGLDRQAMLEAQRNFSTCLFRNPWRIQAGREERRVHHVQVVHFVRPVLWSEHAGFGIGTEAARAADMGPGRVAFGAPKCDFPKRLQHLFHLLQKHRAALDLTGVQTILNSQPLTAVQAWPIGRQDAVVQLGHVFHERCQRQSAVDEPTLVDREQRRAHQRNILGHQPGWLVTISVGGTGPISLSWVVILQSPCGHRTGGGCSLPVTRIRSFWL
jgi:hypothetical protein